MTWHLDDYRCTLLRRVLRRSFHETSPRNTAENIVKHRGGGVGSVVANHRGGGETSMVVTTLVFPIYQWRPFLDLSLRCLHLRWLVLSLWVDQRGRGERLCRKIAKYPVRNLNKEDAMDRSTWKKVIKIGWWSGWWVGECFFLVPAHPGSPRQRTVKWLLLLLQNEVTVVFNWNGKWMNYQ